MEATLLLCDHAEAVNGKLYINGGGWNLLFMAGQPVTIALAMLIEVPWDQTNIRHEIRTDLLTADADLVEIDGNPISIPGQFELGRPPGIKPGTALNAPMAMMVNGLLLEPGGYEWRLFINGETAARKAFQVVNPATLGPLQGLRPPGM